MHCINYMQILKAYLQHFSIQTYHLQGEQNGSVKNKLLTESCYLQSSFAF